MKSDRRETYQKLRAEFPYMVYEGFSFSLVNSELCIVFDFNLAGKYTFRPELRIPVPEKRIADIISDSLIRNIIFNMGMVEMISYWKAACPPKLLVRAGLLSREQIKWWKKLYRNGLGEFFYQNGITPSDDFIDIKAEAPVSDIIPETFIGSGVLIPVGGGKDSVVTLELLSKAGKCIPLIINSRSATDRTIAITGFPEKDTIRVSRSIDPVLLKLNDEGFLNGHTPFSAMLAFTSLLVAALYKFSEIALSNESSANEPTIPGTTINHQYSKSLEFEEDFMQYVSRFLCSGIAYYSFLRPWNELQISGVFAKYSEHFLSFRSCNVGSKTDSWCGKCPKCLFTFIMLAAFIEEEELHNIFGANLFEDSRLWPILEQLAGLSEEKPFECVGTINEVNVALRYIIERKGNADLPDLLRYYSGAIKDTRQAQNELILAKGEFGPHHIPDKKKIEILKMAMDEL